MKKLLNQLSIIQYLNDNFNYALINKKSNIDVDINKNLYSLSNTNFQQNKGIKGGRKENYYINLINLIIYQN